MAFLDYMIRKGRRIICGVSNEKYLLLVPIESRAKIGKGVEVSIKDMKNPLQQIKLLAC